MLAQAPRTLARSPWHLASTCPSRSLCLSVRLQSVQTIDLVEDVAPELRHKMLLPLAATCPTDIIDICMPVVNGAIQKSRDTLTPSRGAAGRGGGQPQSLLRKLSDNLC